MPIFLSTCSLFVISIGYAVIVETSTQMMSLNASFTIPSNLTEMASSIQSAPHCEHTVAGTSLTTTTPKPKSTVNVVFPSF